MAKGHTTGQLLWDLVLWSFLLHSNGWPVVHQQLLVIRLHSSAIEVDTYPRIGQKSHEERHEDKNNNNININIPEATTTTAWATATTKQQQQQQVQHKRLQIQQKVPLTWRWGELSASESIKWISVYELTSWVETEGSGLIKRQHEK